MILRAAISIFLVFAIAAAMSATPAYARKKKYRTKPYPNTGVVRRAPPADFVPPKGADIDMRPPRLVLPERSGTCGAPPCAGGSIRLAPRDIRNYQPGDIRARSPGIR